MSPCVRLGRVDILRVAQSLAQALRKNGQQSVGDASLFLEINSLEGCSPRMAESLASSALDFLGIADNELREKLPATTSLESWTDLLYTAWDKETICFQTSGSTGAPSRHAFAISDMVAETSAAARSFAARSRIVSVMPVHHIYGFMYGPLLANYLNIPIMYAPPLPLASLFEMLRPGDALVAFPFFWQSLLEVIRNQTTGANLALPRDLLGATATGPCPPAVIRDLLTLERTGKSPSLAGMREIYGATEVNGIGMRLDDSEWFELFPIWNSESLEDGTRILRRVLPDGTPGETRPAPDVLIWLDERRFKPERRVDKAVQVAGVNVYPERIAAIIREHPQVRDCAVRLMRPEEGSRLKAFIVPEPLPGQNRAQAVFGKPFRDWLAARLPAVSRPKRIRLGERLPVNDMGKLRDWD